jgi:hypothetical protein
MNLISLTTFFCLEMVMIEIEIVKRITVCPHTVRMATVLNATYKMIFFHFSLAVETCALETSLKIL